MLYKEELQKACNDYLCDNISLRNVYDYLVDYMSENNCATGGMFEAYNTLINFVNVDKHIVKAFTSADLDVIILCLRNNTYTPLALVIATYIEDRMEKEMFLEFYKDAKKAMK